MTFCRGWWKCLGWCDRMMSMFKFKQATSERSLDELADEYTRTVLNPMAVEAEAKLRADNPDLLAQFRAELLRQRAGFAYSFSRHGDFLSIALTRSADDGEEKHWATTINLGLVKTITLRQGRAPDINGSFGWGVRHVLDGEGSWSSSGSSSGRPIGPPGNGWQHEVYPRDEWRRWTGEPFYWQGCTGLEGVSVMSFEMDGGCTHITRDYPRPSEDDQIVFDGLGMGIYAPFGMGEAMHAALLEAISAAPGGFVIG